MRVVGVVVKPFTNRIEGEGKRRDKEEVDSK